VEIPEGVQRAISEAVARRLESELGARGLLLAPMRLTEARARAQQLGLELMTALVHELYPESREPGADVAIEFGGDAGEARVTGALAFGAATARVLVDERARDAERVEFLCAIFNLGIGLVDGMCDEAPELGRRFLDVIDAGELVAAAEQPQPRGWLQTRLPAALEADATAAFTADVIEAFFETLQEVHPHDDSLRLRHRVGEQLAAALDAERRSVDRPQDPVTREQLRECSRATSVLPFQIIERVARGDRAPGEGPSPGTLLGEAIWRIDDLVDLCHDASTGALNGVLLNTDADSGEAALQRLLGSTELADAAAQAGERLAAVLRHSGGQEDRDLFLQFIHAYAGIAPRDS
jgi:hypothetical protein